MEMKITIQNELTVEDAKAKAEPVLISCLESFQGKDVNMDWEGSKCQFSCTSMGLKITGSVEIKEALADVTIILPMAAVMFKSRVEETVKKRLTAALKKDNS